MGSRLAAATFAALTCTPTVIVVGNIHYHSCAGGWYRRYYESGEVTYVVVTAPAGY